MRRLPLVTFSDTVLDTWFERDRQRVALENKKTGRTIVEWRDEAVDEAVEDGFLDTRDFHGSAFAYAVSIGLIRDHK